MRRTTAAALALAALAMGGAAFIASRGGHSSPTPPATVRVSPSTALENCLRAASQPAPVGFAVEVCEPLTRGWQEPTTLPPCATEDSTTDCIWLADQRGNGLGRSFIVYSGQTWYTEEVHR